MKKTSVSARGLSLLATVAVLAQSLLLAVPAYGAPMAPSRQGTPVNTSGLQLDLSSTQATTMGSALNGLSNVNINNGGTAMTVSQTSVLTPAQLAAAQQVLQTGQQTLILGAQGNAVAGVVTIGTGTLPTLAGLIIPAGVTAFNRVNPGSNSLNISGTLQNSGLLNVVNTTNMMTSATMSAANILNLIGGVITAGPNVNLTLAATNGITNNGVITSVHDLNLVTPVLQNTGLISSTTGSVNLSGVGGSLLVNGTGGTIEAQRGNINVNAGAYGPTANINLVGGNYLSQVLNVDAGKGAINGALQNVTSLVNLNGCFAAFGADTDLLNLGTLNVAGDPTYYNTGGSLVLNSVAATNGADLALIAKGDVVVRGGKLDTTSSSPSGDGGSLLIVAGADFTTTPLSPGNLTPPASDGVTVTINGASASGGGINLTGVTNIDTRGKSTINQAQNGGNVSIYAFSGTGAGNTNGLTPGSINLGSADVYTFGASIPAGGNGAGGTAGNVRIYAGATTGAGVTSKGTILTGGAVINPTTGAILSGPIFNGSYQSPTQQSTGSSVAGLVEIATATPLVSVPLQVLNGTVTAGSISKGPVQAASITLNDVNTSSSYQTYSVSTNTQPAAPDAGDITLTAGTTVTARNLTAFGAPAPFGYTPGTAPAGNGGRGGDVFVQSGGNISLANINTTGGGGAQAQINGPNSKGGNGGDGGTVTLQSTTGNISVTSNLLTTAILSAGGAGHTGSFEAAGGTGGKGGTVSIVANLGTALIKGIEASGGGGGGGSGGFEPTGSNYGDGGAGGNGANISVIAKTINFTGYVASNGGGGGGGGGSDVDVVTGGGGGGGGGGSNYQAGFPGTALFDTSSGGGGGGGFVATVGGSAGASNGSNPGPPDNDLYQGGTGAGVLGGLGGKWGLGGFGGVSSSGGNFGLGGNGGGIGEAGTDGLDSTGLGVAGSGGAAGNGGRIDLRARSIAVSGTLFDFTKQTTTNIAQKNASIMALGPTGQVNINSTGTVALTSQVYNAYADLSSNTRDVPVAATVTGSPFVVGSAVAGNGTKGQILSGSNALINTVNTGPGVVTPGPYQNTGEVVLGNNHAFSLANPSLTPAEQIALIQISAGLPQTLQLDTNGVATGGTFNLGFANVPAAGFVILTIPANVAATSQVAALKVIGTGVATINGSLLLPAFGASLTAGSIVGIGNITAGTGASALTLTATSGNIGRTVGGGMPLSITANNVVASAAKSNEISNTLTSAVTLGDMTAKGGALSFSSGGAINLTGTVSAFGGPMSITAGVNGNLVLTGLVNLGGGLNPMALNTSGTGRILQTAGAINANDVLNLNSGSGEISLNNITNGLVVANSAGNVTLKAPRSLQFGSGSTVGGALTVTAESITTSGAGTLTCGSCLFNTSEFNSSTIFSVVQTNLLGTFTVQSPAGYDLSLGGMNVSAQGGINFTSTTGSITVGSSMLSSGIGTAFLAGANSTISTANSVSTVIVNSGALKLSAATVFNPGAFSAPGGPVVFYLTGNSIGTLANSQGDIVLTPNMLINSGGRDLAILAFGNVLASGVPTINLAGTTGRGGNLTVMAGVAFNITPGGPTANDPIPAPVTGTNTSYAVLGASATGGTISLLNTQINTSSFAANGRGGNVFLVANAGTNSKGQVFTGAINTSSLQGKAGNVSIFATGGGIVNGAINTAGKLASGAVSFVAAAPTNLAGTQVINGNLNPGKMPAAGTPVANSGSSVQINGAITTNAPLAGGGNKGSVILRADAGVSVGGGINLSGQGNGQLQISALTGAIIVKGEINASGLGAFVSGKNFTNASAGASVDIQAPQYITINGSINTSGGTINGNGNAGSAGSISLLTTDTATGLRIGNIFVQGSLNAAGGSSTGNVVGTFAGMGGGVDVKSGAFQITGQTFANGALGSIINTGGTGANTQGAGSLALQSSAVQQLPSNFNLLSATASEVALAGAIINIGNPVVVNGTAGNVVSGTTLTSANAGAFTVNSAPVAGLTVTGLQANSTNSASVQLGTLPIQTQVNPMTGTARTKVAPAVALALWQVSHADGNTNAQTIGLSAATIGTAKLTSTNPQGVNSTISFTQADLPSAFSAFVLAASDSTAAGAITMNVSGGSPVINLSSAFATPINIAGTLNLNTTGGVALINSGALGVTTSNNTTIGASNGLVWQTTGTPISFNGTINSPTLLLLNPGGGFGFTQNVGSNVNSTILLSTYGLQSSFTYTNNRGTFSHNFNLTPQKLPAAFGLVSGKVAVSATPTAFSNLTFKLLDQTGTGQQALLQANVPTLVANSNIGLPGGLTITTQSTQVGIVAHSTDLLLVGANITTSTSLNITVAGVLGTTGAISLVNRGGGITASATTAMSIVGGTVINGNTGVTLSTSGANADILLGDSSTASSIISGNGLVMITSGRNLEVSKATVSGKNGVMIRTGLAGDFSDNGGSAYDSLTGSLSITARQLDLASPFATVSTSVSAKNGINLTSSGAMALGNATVGVNINSPGAMTLRGTSFSAKNTISTTGALTIATGTTGAININNLSSFSSTGAASLTGNGITIGGNSTLSAVGVPVAVLGTISLMSNGVIGLTGGNLVSSGTTTVNATGGAVGTGATSILSGGSITIGSTTSFFTDAGNSTFDSSNGALSISTKAGMIIGQSFTSNVNAKTTIGLTNSSGAMTVNGAVTAGTTISLVNTSGAMTVGGNLTAGTNLTLTNTAGTMNITGSLTAGAPNGALTPNIPVVQTSLLSKGAIAITNNNGGITIGSTSTFNSYGGDMTIKSLNPINPPGVAGILIGNTVSLKANGGNLIMLTNGSITEQFSNSGNLYYATALTTSPLATTGTGGAIEMGAGQTISQLGAAQLKPSGTTVNPAVLAPSDPNDVSIIQTGQGVGYHGALVANIATPNNVNVSVFGHLTTLNLNTTANTGGTIVFDQKGAQLIQLDGASFVVAGFKPVAYHYSVAPLTELEVSDDESGAVHQLAHLFVPGHKGVQMLTARDSQARNSGAPKGVTSAEINLTRGQLFMNPLADTSVNGGIAKVEAKRGALFAIAREAFGIRVAACSGPGDVTIKVGGKSIAVLPGEEIIISDHALTNEERHTADGVGRRDFRSFQLATGIHATICDVSIISMLGNHEHLQSLIHPASSTERRIANRLIKTAACVQQVTHSKGVYASRAAHPAQPAHSPYSAVSFNK